jgi:hypothetical protein
MMKPPPKDRPIRFRSAVEYGSDGLWYGQVHWGKKTLWESPEGYPTDIEALSAARIQAAVLQVLAGREELVTE